MTSRPPITFTLLALAVGSACVALGAWQLRRLDERRALNAEVSRRRGLPALTTDSLGSWQEDRRGAAAGRLDYTEEFVLRERARSSVPGVEVVTPMRVEGSDTALLMLRGFVPSADARSYDPALHREADSGAVVGTIRRVPNDSAGARPDTANGRFSLRRLDLATIRARLPYPVARAYLIVDSPATVSPAPVRSAPPPLNDGPHLNYAIQWFAFATIAFGGTVALWLRRAPPAGPDA